MRCTSDRCGSSREAAPLAWANDFDRLVGLMRESKPRPRNQRLSFPIDVVEAEDRFLLQAELAGFRRDSIRVESQNDVLSIVAEQEAPARPENSQLHLSERRFGRFERSLTFATPVDFDRAEATFEDGILTLSIPKSDRAVPRRIPIGSGDRPVDASRDSIG